MYFIIIFAVFALVFSYKRYLGKAALGILLQVFKVWYWLMGEMGGVAQRLKRGRGHLRMCSVSCCKSMSSESIMKKWECFVWQQHKQKRVVLHPSPFSLLPLEKTTDYLSPLLPFYGYTTKYKVQPSRTFLPTSIYIANLQKIVQNYLFISTVLPRYPSSCQFLPFRATWGVSSLFQ